MPFIEKDFRTHPFSVLEGHSLGGTFAVFAMMEQPDLFDASVVISPALWWNEEEQTRRASEFFASKHSFVKTAYFAIGKDDGYGMRQELKRFIDVLPESDPAGFRWSHEELDGEGHMSAPLRAHYRAMKFVFSDMQIPEALFEDFSVERFDEHEKKMAAKYGASAKQTGESYVGLAFHLIEKEDYDGALVVLKRNVEAYPDWHMNYFQLGQLEEKMLDSEAAIASYRIALSLTEQHGNEWSAKYRELIDGLTNETN